MPNVIPFPNLEITDQALINRMLAELYAEAIVQVERLVSITNQAKREAYKNGNS